MSMPRWSGFWGKRARSPDVVRLWVDNMLSRRGQKVIGDSLELFTTRTDVDAEYTAAKLARDIWPNAMPIPLSAAVTTYLDPNNTSSSSTIGNPPSRRDAALPLNVSFASCRGGAHPLHRRRVRVPQSLHRQGPGRAGSLRRVPGQRRAKQGLVAEMKRLSCHTAALSGRNDVP